MLTLVLPLLFQAASGEPQATQAPSPQPSAESAAKPAEPNVVCTMEPVTGTRAKKMRVCKTKSYEKNGERARDTMEMQQRMGGPNVRPPPGVPG
ncbi:MAG TPA: hypothetical protein VFV70_15390 [Hyphomonadaceae bacterium]|nr:hypothetical protein [Hyphomonadaceae bacterium]